MTVNVAAQESTRTAQLVARVYARLLLVGFALVPACLIAYLYFFQDPSLKFENHAFHALAIAAATLEGAFVTYVCWRCYRLSGEPLLRWAFWAFHRDRLLAGGRQPVGAPVDGGRRTAALGRERRCAGLAPHPLAADDDLRHFGHVVSASASARRSRARRSKQASVNRSRSP
ncbi:hypothetical protein J2785_001329 [Burkholderia ambifaria]|nr:hypothetical protein [Burkholderia ambifaria]